MYKLARILLSVNREQKEMALERELDKAIKVKLIKNVMKKINFKIIESLWLQFFQNDRMYEVKQKRMKDEIRT